MTPLSQIVESEPVALHMLVLIPQGEGRVVELVDGWARVLIDGHYRWALQRHCVRVRRSTPGQVLESLVVLSEGRPPCC